MNVLEKIQSLPCRDASFAEMSCDYEECRVKLESERGVDWTITVGGYISATHVGHWDENIIEAVEIKSEDDAIRSVLDAIAERYKGPPEEPGGGTRDFRGPWYLLRVKFIDGTALEVIGQSLELAGETPG